MDVTISINSLNIQWHLKMRLPLQTGKIRQVTLMSVYRYTTSCIQGIRHKMANSWIRWIEEFSLYQWCYVNIPFSAGYTIVRSMRLWKCVEFWSFGLYFQIWYLKFETQIQVNIIDVCRRRRSAFCCCYWLLSIHVNRGSVFGVNQIVDKLANKINIIMNE